MAEEGVVVVAEVAAGVEDEVEAVDKFIKAAGEGRNVHEHRAVSQI